MNTDIPDFLKVKNRGNVVAEGGSHERYRAHF